MHLRFQLSIWILFVSFLSVSGQKKELPYRYQFPDTVPVAWRFHSKDIYSTTTRTLKKNKEFNATNKGEIFDEFARLIVKERHSLLYGGNVYIGWKDMQDYVEQVFRRILPEEFKKDTTFKVFIVREAEFNAFVQYDNSIFINIGLMARISDEAALASILAHELGHYVHYHVFNQYVKFRKGSLNALAASRAKEKEADDYASQLLVEAGYSLESQADAYRLMQHIEDMYEKRSGKKFIHTHPAGNERALAVESYPLYGKSEQKYLVSEGLFKEMKKKANEEMISLMLSEGDYYGCITQGFENYLSNPSDEWAVYAILEGLRRWKLFEPDVMSKKFFTYAPFKPSNVSILPHIREGYLYMDPSQMDTVNNADLFDTRHLAFETNAQAFTYFNAKADKLRCTECLLTNALLLVDYPAQSSPFLARYLATDNALHPDYAKRLKENNTTIKGGVAVLYDIYANRISAFGTEDSTKKKSALFAFENFLEEYVLEKLQSYPDVTFTVNYNDINTRFSDVQWLNSANVLGSIYNKINWRKNPTPLKQELTTTKIRLDLLDPLYWEYCYKRGVSGIQTIDLFLTEVSIATPVETDKFLSDQGTKFGFHTSVMSHAIGGRVPKDNNLPFNFSQKSKNMYGVYSSKEVDALLFLFLN